MIAEPRILTDEELASEISNLHAGWCYELSDAEFVQQVRDLMAQNPALKMVNDMGQIEVPAFEIEKQYRTKMGQVVYVVDPNFEDHLLVLWGSGVRSMLKKSDLVPGEAADTPKKAFIK